MRTRKLVLTLGIFILPLYSIAQYSQAESLALLCKSWGLLNYYHPNTQQKDIDWNAHASAAIAEILSDSSDISLQDVLSQWHEALGEVKPLKEPFAKLPKDTSLHNLDFGWIQSSGLPEEQKRWLLETVQYYTPFKHKTYDWEAKEMDAACNIYFSDSSSESYYLHPTYPGAPRALTAMFRYWSHVQYLYPYKKLGGRSWDSVLLSYIPRAVNTAGTLLIYHTISAFVLEVEDSHADFFSPVFFYSFGNYHLPLKLKYAEGKTLISDIHPLLAKDFGLSIGDIILEKDGQAIEKFRDSVRPYCRASHSLVTERFINFLVSRIFYLPHSNFVNTIDEYSSFTVQSLSGEIKTVEFILDSTHVEGFAYRRYKYAPAEFNDSDYAVYNGNIGYINLVDAHHRHLRQTIKELNNTEALILDIRNYPYLYGPVVSHFFSNDKNRFTRFYFPQHNKFPGTFKEAYMKPYPRWFFPFAPQYKGKLVILADESTQSAAEFTIMAIQANRDVTIIGRNTSGADGNITKFKIDEDMFITVTGLGVCYPDGRPTQKIGIVPDIYVHEDLQAVKEGRDVVLEKALEYLTTAEK